MSRLRRFLVLFMLFFLVGCGAKTWQEHYDLGMKYLMENNYEEAILSFTAAIEIDPMQEDAYLYMAEAYRAQGDYENALAILQQGFDLTGSERLQLQIRADEANAVLAKDSALAKDFTDLYEAIKNKDRSQVAHYLESYPFSLKDAREHIGFYPSKIYFDGKSFLNEADESALYFYGVDEMYFGKMENGLPHGKGIYVNTHTWYPTDASNAYIWFDAEWNHGVITGNANIWDDYSENHKDRRWAYKEIKCSFNEDEIMTTGNIIEKWDGENGTHQCTYSVKEGKLISEEWRYNDLLESYTIPCETHAECGEFTNHEFGTELYRNTYSFVKREEFSHPFFLGGANLGGAGLD